MGQLRIRLLGELELQRDGRTCPLPQSRKTRALLAYLILKGAPQRRDSLCELLWEVPDDPRAALRWSLSKLRPIVNEEGAERLQADRERASFEARDADIDLHMVRRACSDGLVTLDAAALGELLRLFRGPLLEGLNLPSQPAFESWRMGQQDAARRLHLTVLDALIARLDDQREAQIARLRERIDIDPADEGAHNRLVAAMAMAGQGAEAARQAELSKSILAGFGPVDAARLTQSAGKGPRAVSKPVAAPIDLPISMRQTVRFCATDDGVNIAYATVGSGPPILKTANWLHHHLEFDWESPVWRHLFRALAAEHTLVRYDSRGNGLSDWNVSDMSLDAMVRDLKAVADAAGLDRFPLLAISQGCPAAIEFAARWPERVSKLVLYGGYARGWRRRADLEEPDFVRETEARIVLMRAGWDRDNPAYRQMFTSTFIPDASPEQVEWFNNLQRITASHKNAAALMTALGDFDVRDRLCEVKAPTLVMHVRGDERVTLQNGREIAAGIPGAKFVTLDGRNHLILEHEPSWPVFLQEMRAFLAA